MKHILFAPLLICATPALADKPEVVGVIATPSGESWRFDVTIAHGDTGWDDYADGWRVVDAQGQVLATRILAHPHVDEQPFTRSQSGVLIPEGTTVVYIEVSDNLSGWFDAAPYQVDLK